jgi:hypothetical protein
MSGGFGRLTHPAMLHAFMPQALCRIDRRSSAFCPRMSAFNDPEIVKICESPGRRGDYQFIYPAVAVGLDVIDPSFRRSKQGNKL